MSDSVMATAGLRLRDVFVQKCLGMPKESFEGVDTVTLFSDNFHKLSLDHNKSAANRLKYKELAECIAECGLHNHKQLYCPMIMCPQVGPWLVPLIAPINEETNVGDTSCSLWAAAFKNHRVTNRHLELILHHAECKEPFSIAEFGRLWCEDMSAKRDAARFGILLCHLEFVGFSKSSTWLLKPFENERWGEPPYFVDPKDDKTRPTVKNLSMLLEAIPVGTYHASDDQINKCLWFFCKHNCVHLLVRHGIIRWDAKDTWGIIATRTCKKSQTALLRHVTYDEIFKNSTLVGMAHRCFSTQEFRKLMTHMPKKFELDLRSLPYSHCWNLENLTVLFTVVENRFRQYMDFFSPHWDNAPHWDNVMKHFYDGISQYVRDSWGRALWLTDIGLFVMRHGGRRHGSWARVLASYSDVADSRAYTHWFLKVYAREGMGNTSNFDEAVCSTRCILNLFDMLRIAKYEADREGAEPAEEYDCLGRQLQPLCWRYTFYEVLPLNTFGLKLLKSAARCVDSDFVDYVEWVLADKLVTVDWKVIWDSKCLHCNDYLYKSESSLNVQCRRHWERLWTIFAKYFDLQHILETYVLWCDGTLVESPQMGILHALTRLKLAKIPPDYLVHRLHAYRAKLNTSERTGLLSKLESEMIAALLKIPSIDVNVTSPIYGPVCLAFDASVLGHSVNVTDLILWHFLERRDLKMPLDGTPCSFLGQSEFHSEQLKHYGGGYAKVVEAQRAVLRLSLAKWRRSVDVLARSFNYERPRKRLLMSKD